MVSKMAKSLERMREASKLRREQEKIELKGAILDAAAELYLEMGYDKFSLRQVAERVGYTPTTIYLYYPDGKDELLRSVVQRWFSHFGKTLAEAAESATEPSERLASVGRAYVKYGLRYPDRYRLMFMQRADYLQLQPPRTDGENTEGDGFNVLLAGVADAARNGRVAPDDAEKYAYSLWAGVHGLVSLLIGGMIQSENVESLTDYMLDQVLRIS
jgi:AcrR family transcriptional regulator